MKALKRFIRKSAKPGTLRWKVLSARDDILCKYMSYGGFLKYLATGTKTRLRARSLHISLGLECNQRCIMCSQKEYNKKLDPDIYNNKLLPVYRNLKTILITGGEPTILEETRGFMDIVKKENPGVRFLISTNGKAFDQFWVDEFISRGCSVKFSLNAASKETYEKIVNGGDWDRVLGNIKRLVKCRQNKGRSGLEICASFVVIKENAHEINAFPEFCRKLGLDNYHYINDCRPEYDTLSQSECPSAGETSSDRSRLKACSANSVTCYSPYTNLFVDVFGNARVCCLANKNIGNLRHSSAEELFNNREAAELRKFITEDKDYRYCNNNCRHITGV